MTTTVHSPSPLLARHGAVEAEGHDSGVAGHYGDPMREQRLLAEGLAVVDLSHRGVVTVTGPDRLVLAALDDHPAAPRAGSARVARVARPQPQGPRRARPPPRRRRRDGLAHGRARARRRRWSPWLDSMRFMLRVEVADVTADWAVLGEPHRRRVRRRASRWPGSTRGRRWSATPRRTGRSTGTRRPGARWREVIVPRDGARGGRRRPAAGRDLGGRGAAGGRLAPPARARDRPPDDPARGRLAAHRRAPAQGLLPRAGDGRPGAQPRPAAAPARLPPPRRLGSRAARGRAPRCVAR